MAKGKVMMIHLIVGMIKKISLYKMSYFSEPNNGSKKKLNYICSIMQKKKKNDLRNAAGVDTWKFAENVDLACLKPDIEKLDIVQLKIVPVDLSKLSSLVKESCF